MTVQRKIGRPATKPQLKAVKSHKGGGRSPERIKMAVKAAAQNADGFDIDLPHHPDEPKPLGDVKGGCCWIHPAPPKRMFCGHKTVMASSWCAHHYARVYPTRAHLVAAEKKRAA